jgi:hypothetical protein
MKSVVSLSHDLRCIAVEMKLKADTHPDDHDEAADGHHGEEGVTPCHIVDVLKKAFESL